RFIPAPCSPWRRKARKSRRLSRSSPAESSMPSPRILSNTTRSSAASARRASWSQCGPSSTNTRRPRPPRSNTACQAIHPVAAPLCCAKLTSLHVTVAEKMPAVKAVYVIAKDGSELYYAGDPILAIGADTEDHARDALRAVKAELEQLDFLVKEEDGLKAPEK